MKRTAGARTDEAADHRTCAGSSEESRTSPYASAGSPANYRAAL